MAAAQDTQKEQSDRQGRKNMQVFEMGGQVLLNAKNLPTQAVSAVGSTKLRPRFVGAFTVIGVHGHAFTLGLPSSMATHPTFYVGLLKPYRPAGAVEPEEATESPNTVGRRSSSSEQDLPREAGQEQEPEHEYELLRGVSPGPPSYPVGSQTARGGYPCPPIQGPQPESGTRTRPAPSLGYPSRPYLQKAKFSSYT
ncbi:hypothetical protein PF010_g22410 [Phytophthora fragariae]|uniref:Tf2-1-like SH3-like domain-containing protein n=1 Tax=Phytophthora fragariae TaxID=53985 RepID=A0A6A3EQG6_9STRA|nr:hypothetical protein PF003_g21038 [Phytophthora fragariae]KAE8935645.1 hypothetical protein PF009_g14410 [Phytophthora fragariae]KAE9080349.1 hypothetical protein PF010_g22410 [Phytophthora fragariae]KAE9106298.1 hypothetical protein PF007_g13450 [Phytophthora fragariae]KAE9180206.1 hypothetical protein PF004_g24912 [Phytophthora fragariae]